MSRVVRVFWTLHTLKDSKSDRYSKEKRETDFPEMTNPQEAYATLWDKHGKLGRDDRPLADFPGYGAPMSYADIQGWSVVDTEREKPQLDTFEAKEFGCLLTSDMLKDSLSRKPERRTSW